MMKTFAVLRIRMDDEEERLLMHAEDFPASRMPRFTSATT